MYLRLLVEISSGSLGRESHVLRRVWKEGISERCDMGVWEERISERCGMGMWEEGSQRGVTWACGRRDLREV